MSKLGSLYIQLGEPEGELAGCCETAEWAADYIESLRQQLAGRDAEVADLTLRIKLAEGNVDRFYAIAHEAGRVAEREECAKVCDERAMKNEYSANECIRNGEADEVSSIRSSAWQISVCAHAIHTRSTK